MPGWPHTPTVPPPPHVSGGVQFPHCMMPPQPSAVGPHQPDWQVSAVQLGEPHWFGVPDPPHVPPSQPPQSIVPPQPSEYWPQFAL